MSHLQRLATLQQAGFAPRQAAFLAHVVVHGGYFVRRQFVAFTGHPDGGTATAFLRRLRRQGLVHRAVYGRRTHLYRLDERVFHGRLGSAVQHVGHRPSTRIVVRRLMTLDVVLAFGHARLLGTPMDQIEYFIGERDLSPDVFPATWSNSRAAGNEPEPRHFVDAVPVVVESQSDTVSFLCVQGPATTLAGWTTFLDRYGSLLSVLPSARVVFCTVDVPGFERAVRVAFERWQETPGRQQEERSRRLRVLLEGYFRVRDEAQMYGLSSLSRTARAAFERGKRRFSGPRYTALWEGWTRVRRAALDDYFKPQVPIHVEHVELGFHRIVHGYQTFGTAIARALRAPERSGKGRIHAIDSATALAR